VALYLGFKGMYVLAAWINEYFKLETQWLPFIGFILVFVGILVGLLALSKLIDKLIRVVALGFFNRIGGLLFGAAKGVILMSILLWLVNQANLIDPLVKHESYVYPLFEPLSARLFNAFDTLLPFSGQIFEDIEKLFEALIMNNGVENSSNR
jgi:membrane protein required for colicin V production